jgi:predicted ribosome quality control (RQC) complex YloA/Tae2 family protein
MKLRKHINNKRLESIGQLGVDRVINIQVVLDSVVDPKLLLL